MTVVALLKEYPISISGAFLFLLYLIIFTVLRGNLVHPTRTAHTAVSISMFVVAAVYAAASGIYYYKKADSVEYRTVAYIHALVLALVAFGVYKNVKPKEEKIQ